MPVLALLGSAFPPTLFWSCLSPALTQHPLTKPLLRASMHWEYHRILGFFSLFFNFSAVPGLLLIWICFAHLLWALSQQVPRWESASCPIPCIPRAKLSWVLQGSEEPRLRHTKLMDPFQPGARRHREDALIPWLEIC